MQPFKYDTIVFIARLEPLHLGHQYVIDTALSLAEKVVIVLGSCNSPTTLRNPFNTEIRTAMISAIYRDLIGDRVFITSVPDTPHNNDIWVQNVYNRVHQFCEDDSKIALIGHAKDNTSFYLSLFPLWKLEDAYGFYDQNKILLNATDIRNEYFKDNVSYDYLRNVLSANVLEILERYRETDNFKYIKKEMDRTKLEKLKYSNYPYPETLNFVTCDAVVIQANHVLLVKRNSEFGHDKLALPGGFVNNFESIEQACIRELFEETCIDIPKSVIKSKIKFSRVFDDPNRSTLGRIITHAFLIDLNSEIDRKKTKKKNGPIGMTKVKGADDAKSANWYNIASDLNPKLFHDDHYHIIKTMLNN